ncbi:MAG: DUF4215 domain-containing protein [bacterium]
MPSATPRNVTLLFALALLVGMAGQTGCSDDAATGSCGDGVLDPDEQCDDGNLVDGDGCNFECLFESYCGNGIVESGEECDDGNDRGGDGCSSSCQREVGCGNGRLDYGEECDDDNVTSGDGCSSECVDEDGIAICGNGILEAGEDCDDGNGTAGDNCSPSCEIEDGCGDGILNTGEECDDDNTVSGDGCTYNCLLEFVCGDGICDVDNAETCVKCPADCCPMCGDGVLDSWSGEEDPPYADEECDDGNNVSGDGCNSGCQDEDGFATCGNGIMELGEECDDGNTENGDACSSTCTWEFICGDQHCDVGNGENCRFCPGDCCPDCGNNMADAGENCDGGALGGLTCEDFCYDGGTLACHSWCDFDVSGCTGAGPICGDGLAECEEHCDDTDLSGKDCFALGYDGGTLGCTAGCQYDVSSCGALLWYLHEDFEDPLTVVDWTLGGDWAWGNPTSGPGSAYGGSGNAIGTVLTGNYSNNCAYGVCAATSPSIDLTMAYAPAVRFWAWIDTEGYSYDGGNLKVSTDGGMSYSIVNAVVPAYNLTSVGGEVAWGGHPSSTGWTGWTQFDADLSTHAGQTIRLRFDYRTDGSVNSYPGWYVDEILVAEPGAMP